MQEALERVMQALLLGPPPPADGAQLAAWLAPHGLDAGETSAFHASIERLLVYRGLVRGTLTGAVELAIPRSMARLGPLFDEYFDRFLAERGPATHYLRDVTTEWLAFVEPLFAKDARVPAYLFELARHEALEITVASCADTREHDAGEFDLDVTRGLRFRADVRLVRYAFAVHELPSDLGDRSVPERRPTTLFVYRSREHDVRYLELNLLAAGIVERLLDQKTLGAAVTEAAAALSRTPDAAVLDGTARLLADLAERGALLGPAGPPVGLPRP